MGHKELSIRTLQKSDEQEIDSWFKHRGECLLVESARGTGFIVSNGKEDLACGFFIQTETCYGLWEFVQTNPKVSVYLAGRALKYLSLWIQTYAKSLGYSHLFGFVSQTNQSLLKLYKRHGATVDKSPMILVMKEV